MKKTAILLSVFGVCFWMAPVASAEPTTEPAAEPTTEPAAAEEAATNPEAIEERPVTFPRPGAQEYEFASWPKFNDKLNADDHQGERLPESGSIRTWSWITEKPSTNGKVVVLDFWATWCGPCKKSIPLLRDMQAELHNDLQVIAVGGSKESEDAIRKWLKKNGTHFAQAYDEGQVIARALGIRGIPHAVVLSTDGIIRWQGNPLGDSMYRRVAGIVAADPGVSARRSAEARRALRGNENTLPGARSVVVGRDGAVRGDPVKKPDFVPQRGNPLDEDPPR